MRARPQELRVPRASQKGSHPDSKLRPKSWSHPLLFALPYPVADLSGKPCWPHLQHIPNLAPFLNGNHPGPDSTIASLSAPDLSPPSVVMTTTKIIQLKPTSDHVPPLPSTLPGLPLTQNKTQVLSQPYMIYNPPLALSDLNFCDFLSHSAPVTLERAPNTPVRLPPQGLGTGHSLYLECFPQTATWLLSSLFRSLLKCHLLPWPP